MPCDARPLDRMELRFEARDRSLMAGTGATAASVPLLPRRPKKRGPFQDVPVMARAMVERLG
jgi:hypothetical protein